MLAVTSTQVNCKHLEELCSMENITHQTLNTQLIELIDSALSNLINSERIDLAINDLLNAESLLAQEKPL